MKSCKFFLILSLIATMFTAQSQNAILPVIDIYSLEGSKLSTKDIGINEQTVVLVFWSSDDKHSLEQVKLLNEEYENNLKRENIKIIGICTGYSGTMQKIRPLVYGFGIDFDIYIDRNNDLRRAMSIPELPYTIVINPAKDAYRYTGYCINLVEIISDMNNEGMARIGYSK